MLKRSLLSVLLAAGVGLPAQALPSCYMTQADGSMVDLSHMCGVGGPGRGAGPSGGSLGAVVPVAPPMPAVGGGGAAVASTDRELPVLLDKRIDGDYLEIWVRNPRSVPSRETSAYYSVGYWVGEEYEIVNGYIDVGGSTETRQRVRINLRDEHLVIPSNAELEELYEELYVDSPVTPGNIQVEDIYEDLYVEIVSSRRTR